MSDVILDVSSCALGSKSKKRHQDIIDQLLKHVDKELLNKIIEDMSKIDKSIIDGIISKCMEE